MSAPLRRVAGKIAKANPRKYDSSNDVVFSHRLPPEIPALDVISANTHNLIFLLNFHKDQLANAFNMFIPLPAFLNATQTEVATEYEQEAAETGLRVCYNRNYDWTWEEPAQGQMKRFKYNINQVESMERERDILQMTEAESMWVRPSDRLAACLGLEAGRKLWDDFKSTRNSLLRTSSPLVVEMIPLKADNHPRSAAPESYEHQQRVQVPLFDQEENSKVSALMVVAVGAAVATTVALVSVLKKWF